MAGLQALESGLTGALALTAVHETTWRQRADAPRMDIFASRAIAKSMERFGQEPPSDSQLYGLALVGDLVSNSLYYSLVGLGSPEGALRRGALLGLAAGVGALALPGPMGLGKAPSNRTKATQAMTVGLYLLGGIAAGMAYRRLATERK